MPRLTLEEQLELGRRIQAGDPHIPGSDANHARNLLVMEHRWVAFSAIRKSWKYKKPWDPEMRQEDLVGHALEWLIKAADRYDPVWELRFSTLAYYYVFTGIRRARLRERLIVAPCRGDGSEAPIVYFSGMVDVPVEEAPIDRRLDLHRIGKLVDENPRLTEREKWILFERSRGRTLRQIGNYLDLSSERVRQIIAHALARYHYAGGNGRRALALAGFDFSGGFGD